MEVVVTVSRTLDVAPGQAVEVAFAGLPARPYCPTQRIAGNTELNELVFHLRRDRGASARLWARRCIPAMPCGSRAPPAARRTAPAPDASCWSPPRPVSRRSGRSPGRRAHRDRPRDGGGGRCHDADDLYMRPALDWLRGTGVQQVTMAASRDRRGQADVRHGPVTAHLPTLRGSDTVHVAAAGDRAGGGATLRQRRRVLRRPALPARPQPGPQPRHPGRYGGAVRVVSPRQATGRSSATGTG